MAQSPEDNGLFYNVMPKNKNRGPLVNTENNVIAPPKPQLQGQPIAPTSEGLSLLDVQKLRARQDPNKPKNKLLTFVLLGAGILALLGAGFFAYTKFQTKKPAPTQTAPATQYQTPLPVSNQPAQPSANPITTPSDWQKQFFGSEICNDPSICGDNADPDHDGLTNIEEFQLKTDPNNPDSDGDGIADGDEVHVFGGSPLKSHTFGSLQYSDSDNAKGSYDPTTNQKYTPDKLAQVQAAAAQYGLHQPTLTTLGDVANSVYHLGASSNTTNNGPTSTLDTSSQAKLDRDTQRLNTIKKIGIALLKYKADKQTFPETSDFDTMINAIKPYVLVATNFHDPINQSPYIYQYAANPSGSDFTLNYQSETQNQLIQYKSADAQKDATTESQSQNDDTRMRDLANIQSALLVYSSQNIGGTQSYVFPTTQQYKTALVPKYLSSIPKDPKTNQDYVYTVSGTFDSFTLKATLENPDPGTTGYMCDESECKAF